MPAHNLSIMEQETYESIFFHQRKNTRIPGYDYSTHNYYFVTICTHNRKCVFGSPMVLNDLGLTAASFMEAIPDYYPNVIVDKYVIMPNHVHAILCIDHMDDREAPNLSKVAGQFKMAVSREHHKRNPGENLWQRSFHDHIIRNQKSYEKIWLYIEGNPQKWEEDCFYSANPMW